MPRDRLTADMLLPYRRARAGSGRPRVFCFHHAGGDPSAYRNLVHQFAPVFDLQPVRLPRGIRRPADPRHDDLHGIVEAVGQALAGELTSPFLCFGHSMGAVLAAELTAWLERHGPLAPRLLVVSGRSGNGAAHVVAADRWTDDALIRWMGDLGGTATELFDDPGMRRLILGYLRHDLRLLRAYRASYATLSTPILVLGGRDDPEVSEADLRLWRHHTTGEFRLRLFPGGHFYLYTCAREIVAGVEEALRRPVAADHRDGGAR